MAALPPLAFWSLVTPDLAARASIATGDFTEVHFPMHRFVVQSWQQGRLPLWAPGVNAGQPVFADIQFDAFYPPTVLSGLLLGPHGDFTPEMLIRIELGHFFLAELGTYLLLLWLLGRSRAARRATADQARKGPAAPAAIPAALAGAIVFSFSGYLTTYPLQDTDILQVSVWLPWSILALDYVLSRRNSPLALAAGMPVGLAVLAGHPQVLLYLVYAHLLYTLVSATTELGPMRRRLATLVRGLLTLGSGLALGAIQLLPTLQMAPLTVRGDVSFSFLSGGFAPPELVGAVLREGFGGAAPAYLGIAPVVLAVIGMCRGLRDLRAYAVVLGTIALVLSLGRHAFLYRLAYLAAPGFAEVRDQERAIYLVTFAVALLAANGVQQLWGSERRGKVRPELYIEAILALVLAAVALLTARLQAEIRVTIPAAGAASRSDVAGLEHAWLLLAAATLAVALSLWGRRAGRIGAWAFAGLCVFDLLSAHPGYGTQRGRANPYPEWPIIRTLQGDADRPFRISSEGLLPADGNEGLIYGLQDVVGSTPLELSSFAALDRAEQQHALDELHRLALLNVRYVVTKRTFPPGAPLQLLGSQGDAHLYRLAPPFALPRAWLVHQVVVASGPAVWPALGRVDVKQVAVLPTLLDGDLGTPGSGTVRVTSFGNTCLNLAVQAPSGGLLVISQINYPGWQATIDGQPTRILPADGTLDAVLVGPSEHRVSLRFDPPVLHLGALVTAAALTGMLLGAGIAVLRRNRASPHP